jgi:hypothetical protein
MAKLLRLRRGTDTQHTTFTGAEGEVTVNTTNDSLHVHDGSTAGGREVARADLSNVSGTTEGSIDVTGEVQCDSLDVDGAADISGNVTLHGNLDLQDNDKILLGTGDDLEIYHDGSNSFINDNGTGSLFIRGTNFYIQGATAENAIRCIQDGAVTLYHDASEKLATTSTGINVTGTVTCDGLTVDGSSTIQSSSPQLILKDTDSTGSNVSGSIVLQDSSGTNKYAIGDFSNANEHLNVWNHSTSDIVLSVNNGGKQVSFTSSGHWVPADNNAQDLGTSSNQWRNGYFDGTVNCDGLSVIGEATIESSEGILTLKDDNSSNASNVNYIRGRDTNNLTRWYVGHASSANESVYIANSANASIIFETNGAGRAYIDSTGHFVPWSNNTYDLGTSSNRWRNLYTNDLNLSNEGGANDVDGTWGSWTIQEGEDDLFLLNRRNGKKYKFNLSEVN